MSISEARTDLHSRLASFLWNQWAQMGVLATAEHSDRWAADPEAPLLLSFEVGREEPRLFEEVLDWLVVNERLISVQRLRNLARDEADRALVEAVVGWLGQRRRRARLEARAGRSEDPSQPQPFFRNSRVPVADPDPAFLAQGFLKARSEPSGKSQAPNLLLPINFAFRLRGLLGIGARAEAMRVLLTSDAPRVNTQAIAASTAYTKRNAQEAVTSLSAAGALTSFEVGNEQRFSAPRDRWSPSSNSTTFPSMRTGPSSSPPTARSSAGWPIRPTRAIRLHALQRGANPRRRSRPDLQFAGIAIDNSLTTRPTWRASSGSCASGGRFQALLTFPWVTSR